MTLNEWIAETEAERPDRALWPSETDARRFRDVWCTGRERPPPRRCARRSRRTASRRRGAPGASPRRASRPTPGIGRRTSCTAAPRGGPPCTPATATPASRPFDATRGAPRSTAATGAVSRSAPAPGTAAAPAPHRRAALAAASQLRPCTSARGMYTLCVQPARRDRHLQHPVASTPPHRGSGMDHGSGASAKGRPSHTSCRCSWGSCAHYWRCRCRSCRSG